MIQMEEVHKSYGDREILKGISLYVQEGESVALCGENGAGKTTLLQIISSVEIPDSGKIRILNSDKISKDVRRKMGVVFQRGNLDACLSVEENLKLRMLLYGKEDERISGDILVCTGVLPFLNRRYGLLSGGEQRRADLAAALVGNPRLLIMDEPTEGLDESVRMDIWKILLQRKKRQRMTLLYTTHYKAETKFADYVYFMRDGRVNRREACQTPLLSET